MSEEIKVEDIKESSPIEGVPDISIKIDETKIESSLVDRIDARLLASGDVDEETFSKFSQELIELQNKYKVAMVRSKAVFRTMDKTDDGKYIGEGIHIFFNEFRLIRVE